MSRENPQKRPSGDQPIQGKNFKLLFVTGFWLLIMLLAISSQLVHTPSCRNILEVISLFEIPNPDKPEIPNIKKQIPNKTQTTNHNKQYSSTYQGTFDFV